MSDFLSILTGGLLHQNGTQTASVISRGLESHAPPQPKVSPQPLKISDPKIAGMQTGFSAQQLAQLQSLSLGGLDGGLVVPTSTGVLNLGNGSTLDFDSDSANGRITPVFASTVDSLRGIMNDDGVSYVGSDMKVMIELADPDGNQMPRFSKQLLEMTTLSVSVFRSKSQVRAAGFINPKGVARGTRTIAGSMIMTVFTAEVLLRFLTSGILSDQSKDSHYMKVDQLPSFNMSILFVNEAGFASYRRLLGVEFVSSGTNYSIQDLISEDTVSYLARDFTPLMPLNLSSMFRKGRGNQVTDTERTVRTVWDRNTPPSLSEITTLA